MYNKFMKNSVKALFPKISTIAVLLALITISIFQYNWVVSSAATDISELYRSLTSTIANKMISEFDEKPLFRDEMEFMNYTRSDNEILQELVNQNEEFTKSNENKFSLDIYNIDLISLEYKHLENDEWILNTSIPDDIAKVVRSFNVDPSYIYENGMIYQILPIKNRSNQFVILKINTFGYYEDKIYEYTNNILTKYEVVIYDRIPKDGSFIDGQGYTYSPFIRKNWFSQIPLPISIFPSLDIREPNIDLPRRSNQRPPRELERNFPGSIVIDLLEDGIPLVTKKENYLTIQWLLNLLLLIGIGIGYFLIYFQIISLKKLRLREKEFIATITHELRTPLTVIQSAADNIERGFLSEERVKQYGHLITGQSTRLSSMIEGILLFSRLEGRAEQPPVLNRIFYNDIKISLEVFAQSLMDTGANKITVDFNELPISSISDKETIELILTNFISNSNKHAYNETEPGNIRIIGSILSKDMLIFKVEDDGVGIEKSERKYLFEPFYRGKRSHKQQIKGSGLGLFLSNKKANLIGGKLEIDSHLDKGSVFKLIIPYQKA